MLLLSSMLALACLAVPVDVPIPGQYPPPLTDASYAEAGDHVWLPDEITQVTVTMDPADLQWLLDNRQTDIYKRCQVRIVNSVIDETYADVGIRPRGGSGRTAKKNPWKLDFGEFVSGRKVHGVTKMNLGGDAPDPSLSRSTMAYRMFRWMGVPSSRTHHAWLKINDGSLVEGLYVDFEQVDDDFVDAWFGNEDGALYKCRNRGGPANLVWINPGTADVYRDMEDYEEKIRGGDYQPLAEFIDFVNNSSDADFAAQIQQRLNVDGFLRAMSVDMVLGQWDGLWIGANNYYLYQNTRTSRIEYIPWDLDHTFGMDYLFFPIIGNFGTNFATRGYQNWGMNGFGMGGNGQPPLLGRLLAIPKFDQLLQRYVRVLAAGLFHPDSSLSQLDDLKAMLQPQAFQGSFSGSSMDWGWSPAAFDAAFEWPANYSLFNVPNTWGVNSYIRKRSSHVYHNYPVPPALPTVRINEVVADNESVLADEAGEFEDYLELYNFGELPVDLSGMRLGDYAGAIPSWSFPAGTVLMPQQFLLVWCDAEALDGPLHADFKISADGGGVYLWNADPKLPTRIDSALVPAAAPDPGWARGVDGVGEPEWAMPTPGTSNGTATGLRMIRLGHCGEGLELAIGGATPGELLIIAASNAAGTHRVQVPGCGPLDIGLAPQQLRVVAQRRADGAGNLQLPLAIPSDLCGKLWFQAAGTASCQISNLLQP